MFKSLKKKMKDQRGLTLIELLAVIVILGIIAAIAIPAIGKLIGNTEDKATVSEGIQIINAAKLYVAEKNPDTGTFDENSELADFVDNADGEWTVSIVKETSGKYTYSLTEHPSIAIIEAKQETAEKDGVASEQELINFK